ncbi:hypothetical protein DFH07DRAFT_776392 [Mycena maculata]|uniref:Uncharacterized protein n=1 Tax=Mycena maculata TaxID=230809 RepID=A0AAD7IMC6_9AGAR|nr:hypothetical protein DFH07DRAFT_776392 [Mycena maculata]
MHRKSQRIIWRARNFDVVEIKLKTKAYRFLKASLIESAARTAITVVAHQKVPHKRTFDVPRDTIAIKDGKDGLDSFDSQRSHAIKFLSRTRRTTREAAGHRAREEGVPESAEE